MPLLRPQHAVLRGFCFPSTGCGASSRACISPLEHGGGVGLYVHIPFCTAKCDYCDFFSIPRASIDDSFVDAIIAEAGWYKSRLGISAWRTVYVGGGTPSLLLPGQLERLLRELCGRSAPCEVTVELNPEGVGADLLSACAEGGATRLSLGIQSLDEDALSSVHRRCTASRARDALSLLRGRWNGAVNLDCIAGLPGQSRDTFMRSLGEMLSFGPEHLSLYTLSVEEGTPLAARLSAGERWDSDEADTQWLLGREAVVASGLEQYEVSNFARPGFESMHNRAYWEQLDYVGVGPGACGTLYVFDGGQGLRWSNTADITHWCSFWNGGLREALSPFHDAGTSRAACCDPPWLGAVRSTERLSLSVEEFEYLMLGLRTTCGICESEYRRRFSALSPWHGNLADRLGADKGPWSRFCDEGRATTVSSFGGRRFSLTASGLLVLNTLLRQL